MKNFICEYLPVLFTEMIFFLICTFIIQVSKKQPKTYFLPNLRKIPDIFVNFFFHISNMKIFSYFEMEKILPLRFSYMIEKPLLRAVTRIVTAVKNQFSSRGPKFTGKRVKFLFPSTVCMRNKYPRKHSFLCVLASNDALNSTQLPVCSQLLPWAIHISIQAHQAQKNHFIAADIPMFGQK